MSMCTKTWSWLFSCALTVFVAGHLCAAEPQALFNVRDYGATGRKADDAKAAIQKAIDACAAAGGGMVYIPSGDYTSGTLHLRSHVRLHIEAGATLFASKDESAYDKASLIYAENVDNITIEGRGTVEGQAEYVRSLQTFDDAYIRPNKLQMDALGKPLLRSFPKGFGQRHVYPRLVLLIRCKDVRITGLSFLHSPSWTINPYACERLVIDGIYVHSDLKDAVWADGIDPDGCKDVRIANSTIVTGDDAIVFYSADVWGPPLACENITVTNCRLSSASSAIKFCDGNQVAVRNVTINNCVITDSNRGIAFMVFDGGYVSDVVISNVTIDTRRFEWFWWGDGDAIHFNIKRRSEVDGVHREHEPAAGSIRNVILRNIIAHSKGTSFINGHPDSWLENVSLENIKFFLSTDPAAPYDKSVDAMRIRWAKNLKLEDVEIIWEQPELKKWENAVYLEDVSGLQVQGLSARQAHPGTDVPAVMLNNVDGALIRSSAAQPGTRVFIGVAGSKSRDICMFGNDLRHAEVAYRVEPDAKTDVRETEDLSPSQQIRAADPRAEK